MLSNGLDGEFLDFTFREDLAQRRPLSMRRAAAVERRGFLARFEVSRRESAPESDSVRLAGAENPVRFFVHEPSTRIVPTSCRPPPLRTRRDGRLPGGALRVRQAAALGATRPRQRLLLPAPRSEIVEGSGSLPEGGGAAHPGVPGGDRAFPGRQVVHQQRGRAGPGHHAGEQRRGPAEVLLPVEAGGEGGRGGDLPGGGGSEAGSGHEGGDRGGDGGTSRGSVSPR
jgi:hypothetical protein